MRLPFQRRSDGSSLSTSSSPEAGPSALQLAGQSPGLATPGVASMNSTTDLFAGANGSGSISSSDAAASSLQRQMAYEIMAETLFRYAQRERLFSDNPNVWNGVALRLAKGKYVCSPQHDQRLLPWVSALALLNADAVVTLTSTVVAGITVSLPAGSDEIALSPVDRVQVVEYTEELASCRKAQGAALIRSEARLVVWSDKVEDLMTVAKSMEQKMVKYVWERATGTMAPTNLGLPSDGSSPDVSQEAVAMATEKEGSRKGPGGEILVTKRVIDEKNPEDPEMLYTYQERHTNLQAPLLHGLAVALNTLISCLLIRTVVREALIDGSYLRFAIIAAVPLQFCITLFFSDNIIASIALLLGPIRQMSLNSRYYSGTAPERMTGTLPHITIQMPVYKESLETVLAPTIESINVAIKTYELQGGTASILVSEDGMLLVSEEEREKRLDFYDRNQVAWIARPGHNVDGYVRKGRFKKASNLNFTCVVSLAVEKIMAAERPAVGTAAYSTWSFADEQALYDSALERALHEAHPLAQASGNVRIGDLILMIDSDTRVPEDCFLDAASEMTQCPDVAVLQHCSGVMYVTKNNYFEQGIGFFTRCVNFAISYAVANGDTAPFMGHNAYLRWTAVQEAAFVDPIDGEFKMWADTTVSEDFEMSIRLLMKGYITRWATYSNDEYLEGVSLTCDDELNRWQKYAFGVSELIFHPVHKWYKGPITPLWRRFMWAKEIPVHAKFSNSSYVFSYYAIASALPLTMGLSVAQALFAPTLDGAFLPPFNVFVAVIVIFTGLGNLAQLVAKFRARKDTFATALKQHIVWLPFMIMFFTGLSYHCLTALLSHGLSYNMTWGATNKDLEDSNFFLEVPSILKKYWKMLLVCIICIAGWVVLAIDVLPIEWQYHGGFFVLWCPLFLPSMHILYHIALNPQLLRFSF